MMHYGATKLQANFRGYKDRKKVSEIRTSLDSLEPQMIGTDQDYPVEDDSDAMHQGATKLQANFRGFKDRKAVGEKKAMIASFDPSNDAMQEGAAKLQASFRGFKDRKRMNEIRGGQDDAINDDTAIQGQAQNLKTQDDAMDNTNMENMLAAALGGGLSDNIDDVLAAGLNADDDDISVRQSTEVRPIAATEAH